MFENSSIGLYAKAIMAAAAAAAATALNAMSDGVIDTPEWIAIAVAFVVGLGAVAATPNIPETVRKYVKAFVAAFVAGAGVVTTVALAGAPLLTVAVALKVGLAILATFGIVYSVSNAAESDPVDPVTHKIQPVRGKQSTLAAEAAGGAPVV